MKTYSEVARRLRTFDSQDFGGGDDDEHLVAAERALGLRISGGYRSFLQQFGWGGLENLELYWLGSDVPAHQDLEAITQSERAEMQASLRTDLLPIMNDGAGDLYCLDTSTGNEHTLVLWDHTTSVGQLAETESENFASWLTEELEALSGGEGCLVTILRTND